MKKQTVEMRPAEIAVVGERYGDMSHVIMPIFDRKESVESVDIKDMLGYDEVMLVPMENNPEDSYAVAVKTEDRLRIGYVWMYQAPAVYRCVKNNRRKFIRARISRICSTAGVIMVVPEAEVSMTDIERNSKPLDMEWASDMPQERTSSTEHDLCIGLELLYEKLMRKAVWTPKLQHSIDDLLTLLPQDLSAHHYKEGFDVYNIMMQSDDERLRLQGEIMLQSFVHRGSKQCMEWWAENWLPSYFSETENSDLLRLFEEDGYTLERVEQLLEKAPYHLFTMYKTSRTQFATHLYYSSLPLKIYNRLLTLLAVRELMMMKGKGVIGNSKNAMQQELTADSGKDLFHFIHPAIGEEEANEIHDQVKRLVRHFKIQEICQYLKQLKMEKKILLPTNPAVTYEELTRIGMPTTEGYSIKTFSRFYVI